MRTKHLFMTMVLPLAFAACTSDEFETIQNEGSSLAGRKALENVELSFGDDAYTRIAVENGNFTFEEGDGVGACLVDYYSPTNKAEDPAYKNYMLSEYIQTNYQYLYDGATWTTTAKMVEGNYVFYAPYNGKHLSRTPITTGVPTTQELQLDADGKVNQYSILEAFAKSGQPAYIGYKFLEATGQDYKVSVDMKPIFAYPLITFTNDKTGTGAGDVVITKFVITASKSIATKAPLTIGTANAVAAKGTGVVGSLFDLGTKDSENGAWVTNKYMIGNKTANVVGTAEETASMIVVNVPNGALTVAQGESVMFNVVLPADNSVEYTVYAYDNAGKAYQKTVSEQSYSAGKMYADIQYSNGNALATAAGIMTSKTSVISPTDAPTIVTSTEELQALVAGATADVTNIQVANSSVKLTPEVASAANPTLTYTFKAPISIVGGEEEAAEMDRFGFNGAVTIESGIVSLKATNLDDVTVKEGATLNLYGAETSATVKTEKGATLVLGNGKDAITIATLTNAGEATIAKNATVTASTNEGTIINQSTKLPTNIASGTWINEGDVTLSGATTLSAGVTLVNKVAITTETNTLTIAAASGNTPAAVLDNEGMLINDASTNKVIVYGKLIVGASSMYKGAAIDVSSGRIDLYEGYQAANAFTFSSSGTLAQVVTSYDNTVTESATLISNINMLSVSSTLTLDKAITNNVKNIELGNGATFNLNGTIKVTDDTKITTVGDATIKGIYTLSAGSAKTLDIIVAKGKTLTLSGVTIENGDGTTNLKGVDTTVKSKYVLTSGANVSATIESTTIELKQ